MSRNLMAPLRHFAFSATDQGPSPEQQDALGCFEDAASRCSLVIVCDGVGGRSGGQAASRAAVEEAWKLWMANGPVWRDPEAVLRQLCSNAHDAINRLAERPKQAPRSTIAAVYLTPKAAHWVHVGDSRVYHFREGQLVERTKDHSVLQILIEQGEAREDEASTHPDQRRLVRTLGGEERHRPSCHQARIDGKDAFLLCSDGFWERITPGEMAALTQGENPAALRAAVKTAVTRNGPAGDNVTAVAVIPRGGLTENLLRLALIVGAAAAGVLLLGAGAYGLWQSHRNSISPVPTPVAKVSAPTKVAPEPVAPSAPMVSASPSAAPTVPPEPSAAPQPIATPEVRRGQLEDAPKQGSPIPPQVQKGQPVSTGSGEQGLEVASKTTGTHESPQAESRAVQKNP